VAPHPAKLYLPRLPSVGAHLDRDLPVKAGRALRRWVSGAPGVLARRAPVETIFHGPRDRRRVALTFDDGPDELTPAVLDLLARHGARATFFVIGRRVGTGEDALRRALREGHEIGNHTWNHRPRGRGLYDLAQLACTSAAIRHATGVEPRLLRAPHGELTLGLRRAAGASGLTPVCWDVDPADWSGPGAAAIVSRVLGTTQSGSIVVLHDCSPDHAGTLTALEQILGRLRDDGYELVTVSELLAP
jgi:peptidoglycan-N-acetylglucosamine deacetylase